jgi:hypothetical protein
VAQDFPADSVIRVISAGTVGHDGPGDRRDPRDHQDQNDRWPDEMPSVKVARVLLKVDESITLKRTAAAVWLTAHGDAVPSVPIKPTRMELAIIVALVETYGPNLYRDSRFVSLIDFIADYGAVKFVQRVMYGTRPVTDFDVTAYTAENARLADAVRDARVAFEFLCATWPEVLLAQTHAVLAGLGIQVRAPDAEPVPPLSEVDGRGHGVDEHDTGSHDGGDHNESDDDLDSEEVGHA